MMTDYEIGAAIRVVFDRVNGGPPGQWAISDALMEVFRAGYAAGQAAAVPREPTQAMVVAGNAAYIEQSGNAGLARGSYRAIFEAMYDAALGAQG